MTTIAMLLFGWTLSDFFRAEPGNRFSEAFFLALIGGMAVLFVIYDHIHSY